MEIYAKMWTLLLLDWGHAKEGDDEKNNEKKMMDIKYLINLGSNKLFVSAIILGRHQMFDDVNQAPKCILFGHKKKCNRHQSVKALKK